MGAVIFGLCLSPTPLGRAIRAQHRHHLCRLPQASVEHTNQTLQGLLAKELRLRGITMIAGNGGSESARMPLLLRVSHSPYGEQELHSC